YEAHEATLPGLHLPLGQTPAGVVARTRVEHVSVGHDALVGAPELFRGYPFVDVVDLVNIDPVRLQPTQRVLQMLTDLVGREAAVVVGRTQIAIHRPVHLGRQHDLVTHTRPGGKPGADDLLRAAPSSLTAVYVRGVDEGDAHGERLVQDRVRLLL